MKLKILFVLLSAFYSATTFAQFGDEYESQGYDDEEVIEEDLYYLSEPIEEDVEQENPTPSFSDFEQSSWEYEEINHASDSEGEINNQNFL